MIGLLDGTQIEAKVHVDIKNNRDGVLFDKSHKLLEYKLPGDRKARKVKDEEIKYLLIDQEDTKMFLRRMYHYSYTKHGLLKDCW